MKKFILFATLISLGLFRLNAQQPLTQEQTVMPEQPPTQGQSPTQGQPIMPEQPPTHGQSLTQENNSASPGLTLIHINMVVLGQANTNTNSGPMSFHFTQSTIADNDILGLINDEFGTSFSTTNGDQLAVSNFLDGKFIVLGATNNVLLEDASSNANGDHYELNFLSANTVLASQESTNATAIFSVTDGSLNYVSGAGTNSFHLEGLTMISDSYFNGSSNSTESFELTGGIGSISFPGSSNNVSGVLTGNVSGSGLNNAPPL